MNQHVTAPVEHIDPETGEITEVSPSTAQPTADQVEQTDAPVVDVEAVEAAAPAAPAAPVVEAQPVPESKKRTFPLQPVVQELKPKLPTPAADRIDPDWDIARVANRGAVHLERVFVMSEKLLWPSIIVALLAFLLIFNAMPSVSGMGRMHGMGGGGVALMTTFLPFFVVGVVLVALIMKSAGLEYDVDIAHLGGGMLVGFALMALWMYSVENPNSSFAWILLVAKIALAIGLVLWIGNHLLKIRRSGESKAILWMAGTYVGVVVIASVALTGVGKALSGFGPSGMSAISSMLTFDPDSYFDLGGGLRGGPEQRWMSDYAPEGGLSVAELNSLIASVRSDYVKHSKDAANWEEVTKLEDQPIITRPAKAIRDHGKKLPNGVVVIPEDEERINIVAHVEGQWSLTIITPGDYCTVVLGPFDPKSGCENATTPAEPINGYVREILATLKPTPAVAEVKE